jgi:hypothetical protein
MSQLLAPALSVAVALLGLPGCGNDGPGPDGGGTPNLVRACVRSAACDYQAYPRIADCVDSYDKNRHPAVASDRYGCVDRARTCAEVAACFGVRGQCDRSFPAACADGDAIYCDLIDKRVYTDRCRALGLQCTIPPGFSWASSCTGSAQPAALETVLRCEGELCVQTGAACGQPDSPTDRCAGELLESCLGGQWVRFDCRKLGLGPCRTEGDTPATTWARCTPPTD